MAKTIRVSEALHAVLKAHNRESETMEETLRRLMGGPDPEVLATIVDDDGDDDGADGAELRRAIECRRKRGRDRRKTLRERFE